MQQLKPLIPQGWLRAFLFLIVYLFMLLGMGGLMALFTRSTSPPTFYTTILGSCLLSFVFVFVFTRFINRSKFVNNGWQWKGFARERSIGLLTGIFLCGLIAVVLWLMQLLQWFTDEVDAGSLLFSLALMFLIALSEELVFRGYLLNNLMQSMPKQTALLLSALLFAILHSLNPDFNLTSFLAIALAGILLGINYIFTRNLWFGIALHLSWNYVQGPLLGFKVSGLSLPSLLLQDLKGSVLLTGGDFGLEASWLTVIVFLIAIPAFYRLFMLRYGGKQG